MMRLTFLALATLAYATLAYPAEPQTKEAIAAHEKEWAAATMKADAGPLNKLLAEDLNYIHSTGMIDSKKMFIDKLVSGEQKYTKLQHEGMEIRFYGSTSIVTTTAQVESTTKGVKNAPGRLRFIHVWYYSKGAWQMVAHQSLRIP